MPRLSKAKLAERRAAEWELYVKGWTMPQIAREYGLDVSTISDDLRMYREALPELDRQQMIQRHHDTLADITKRLDEISRLEAPPVTAGKDGDVVIDPDTGQIVRDYGAQITALGQIRATLAQEAKLAGLNAADKVEVSGSVTVNGPVDQELAELAAQLGIADPAGCTPAELSGAGRDDVPAS